MPIMLSRIYQFNEHEHTTLYYHSVRVLVGLIVSDYARADEIANAL